MSDQKLTRVKTADLTDAALDWAVANSLGYKGNLKLIDGEGRILMLTSFNPSSNWAQGGLIIEREEIQITPQGESLGWYARMVVDGRVIEQFSEKPLDCAMRCFVASTLGNEIEVPTALIFNNQHTPKMKP